MTVDLRDLDHAGLEALMLRLGERRFRANQLFRWVHARGATSLDEMTDVSRALRQRLREQVVIGGPVLHGEQVSADGTRKLRLATADGRLIETVLIPEGDARHSPSTPAGLPDERLLTRARPSRGEHEEEDDEEVGRKLTLCISSQVGCALDCRFCATARLGFGRHLRVGEIVGQVYVAERLLSRLPPEDPTRRAGGRRVTNVVFMGMGEPLHNYENLVQSLRLLLDPRGRNLSRRRVTVSTAGLVPGIERLAAEGLGMNLAVSLNATTDEQRDRLMPINRKYNLATLLGALRRYPLERRQRITIEYVLLAGVNDSLEDAERLPQLLRGIPCKINLIPWNPHPGSSFVRPEPARVLRFQQALLDQGMSVYLRKTRGVDIDAACGQLAAGWELRTEKAIILPQKPRLGTINL
ncbi:MAG: 23S rRNA (adenine(2503)-C(2))-methyltransferase RlmN [Myxococcales bacterium]|nr:23S rRNA (adenine(2503)-C(2))-methyltransferase RlmN [Myxococcota bacterium]MDW8281678.1 23S rRNA (adenine(2503)-C(2))-methyltransferase RlmN [Myxococcales bacterium]